MSAYLLMYCSCWGAAFFEAWNVERCKKLEIGAAFLLACFAGLRFETGYDWVAYLRYFDEIPTLYELARYGNFESFGTMEPLFGILNSLLKSVGAPFQAVLLVSAVFNAAVITTFLRRHSKQVLFCLAIYFSWVFLKIQMGSIRQSICCSFVFLALDALLQGQRGRYYTLVLLGMGFQYSGVIFLLIGPLLTSRVGERITPVALLVGSAIFIGAINILDSVMPVLSLLSVGFVRQKLEYYLGGAISSPPPINYAYSVGTIGFLLVYRNWAAKSTRMSDTVFYNLAFVLVMMQLLFWQLPWFWNRVFYFTIIPQACALTRMMAAQGSLPRVPTLFATAAASLLVFGHFISRPEKALPYVPYQSYVTHALQEEWGDGDVRMTEYNRSMSDIKKR